jgi:hypothetical protein
LNDNVANQKYSAELLYQPEIDLGNGPEDRAQSARSLSEISPRLSACLQHTLLLDLKAAPCSLVITGGGVIEMIASM